MMLSAFANILTRLGLVRGGDRVVLAVSGGVDSMVLLECFRRTCESGQLVAAHVNHRLRGAQSDGDEAFVSEHCRRVGLECISHSQTGDQRSESELRTVRRGFLELVRAEYHCRWIATGHHADDNLETFLMRLIRGSSLTGLSGMRRVNGCWLKPFLEFSRADILEWAQSNGVQYREDRTNFQNLYYRNRVRQNLVPPLLDLAREFGGADAFRSRMQSLSSEVRELSQLARSQIDECYLQVVAESAYFIKLQIGRWESFVPIVRRGVVHRIIAKVSSVETSRRDVERTVEAIVLQSRGLSLTGGVEVSVSYGWAFFQSAPHRTALEALAAQEMPADRCFNIETSEGVNLTPIYTHVRLFQKGDRFQGTGNRVGRYLMKNRVPRLERPLVQVEVNSQSLRVTKILKP